MPYVIGLLIIIVCLLYPPLFAVGLTLFLLLCLLGFLVALGPIVAVVGGIGAIWFAFWSFGLEDDVVGSVKSRQGTSTVLEVLVDAGVTVSDREDCALASCRVYNVIENLIEDRELSISGSDQTVHSSDQVLLLPQK